MQSENRFFDDLSKVLNGVAGTVAGMGREAQDSMRERVKEFSGGIDFVSREEFDAVKQMAANARAEAELLKERVEALESALGKKAKPVAKKATSVKAVKKSATPRKTATKKPAAKKTKATKKPATKK